MSKEFSFPNSGTCSKQTNFVLNDDQWQAFQHALDRPVQAKPRLKKLLGEPGVLD